MVKFLKLLAFPFVWLAWFLLVVFDEVALIYDEMLRDMHRRR